MNFLFLEVIKIVVFLMFPIILFKTFEGLINNKKNIFYLVILLSFFLSMLLIKERYLILYNTYLSIALFNKDKRLYFFIIFIIIMFNLNILSYLAIQYFLIYLLFYIKKDIFTYFIFISVYFYSYVLVMYNVSFIDYLLIVLIFYFIELYINKIILKNLYLELQDKYNNYLFGFIHEVKNPLSVVLGYLEIIKKKENYDLGKTLFIIDKEVNESLKIIEEYLMYGRFSVNFDYLDINLLLKEVFLDFKKLENAYDMNLNFYYDEEEIIVFGDYSKLKQVFVNVIKNGIEAKEDKKLIIDIDYKIVKGNIVIDINDNGKGVSNASLIGKEYYSTKINGNGLGSMFSKKILNLHNGDIKYISNGVRGCDVRINLPIITI